MKANKTNLMKALRLCAKAHNTTMVDYPNEARLIINVWNVPTKVDENVICEAFYRSHEMVEPSLDGNAITVWIDLMAKEVLLVTLSKRTVCFAASITQRLYRFYCHGQMDASILESNGCHSPACTSSKLNYS